MSRAMLIGLIAASPVLADEPIAGEGDTAQPQAQSENESSTTSKSSSNGASDSKTVNESTTVNDGRTTRVQVKRSSDSAGTPSPIEIYLQAASKSGIDDAVTDRIADQLKQSGLDDKTIKLIIESIQKAVQTNKSSGESQKTSLNWSGKVVPGENPALHSILIESSIQTDDGSHESGKSRKEIEKQNGAKRVEQRLKAIEEGINKFLVRFQD